MLDIEYMPVNTARARPSRGTPSRRALGTVEMPTALTLPWHLNDVRIIYTGWGCLGFHERPLPKAFSAGAEGWGSGSHTLEKKD